MTAETTDHTGVSTGRVEAFSDGVLAIAITLLVLDLRAPEVGHHTGSLAHALLTREQLSFLRRLRRELPGHRDHLAQTTTACSGRPLG